MSQQLRKRLTDYFDQIQTLAAQARTEIYAECEANESWDIAAEDASNYFARIDDEASEATGQFWAYRVGE